ncbi:MAG TPA: TadE family protein [Candidatus Nitrosotalea sp.]|nr:TadE family protein [Candidatus Nitrosotalea sp.]
MRKVRGQRAQSLVEFALVAPILLLLLLVTLDFGRGLFYYSQMSAAAREGARQAVLQSNANSNTAAPACSPACQTLGVLPTIRALASFGYPVVYQDSTSASNPPWYGSYSSGANAYVPGTLQLSPGAAKNTLYVFIYEYQAAASPAPDPLPEPTMDPDPRWACTSCDPTARVSGHNFVVVDVKMNWQPVTLGFLGLSSSIPFDAQTVERIEF